MSVFKILKTEMENINEMTTTENGDSAYISSGNANLDFFGLSGACRYYQAQVLTLFKKALQEDPVLALKNILFLRDIRGGLGERESFRTCFRYLCQKHAEAAVLLLPLIVNYGRYDDLFVAIGSPAENSMVDFVRSQLQSDITNWQNGNTYSLLSKWLPSINSGSPTTHKQALFFAARLGYGKADYRKMLSLLRKGKILENHLREKDYSFDYAAIPAKAFSKYQDAFLRNDASRFEVFLKQAMQNPHSVHAGTLYPYDIIREFSTSMTSIEKDAMQVKWNALPRHQASGNTIVVRDGSGSMAANQNRLPLYIATSLAILFAEQISGEFANHFISFSSKPELIELPESWDLYRKLEHCYLYDDYTNTDIAKVYQLIYKTSLKISNPTDYIRRIVIISDMEFDQGTENVPTYESMKQRFDAAGIPIPEIVYWNVCARNPHFAAKPSQPNIRFVSGASHHVMEAILNNEAINAFDLMNNVLKKYELPICDALLNP